MAFVDVMGDTVSGQNEILEYVNMFFIKMTI